MTGRRWKQIAGVGLLAGAAYAAWRWLEARRVESGLDWESQPFPFPPKPHPPTPPTEPDQAN